MWFFVNCKYEYLVRKISFLLVIVKISFCKKKIVLYICKNNFYKYLVLYGRWLNEICVN